MKTIEKYLLLSYLQLFFSIIVISIVLISWITFYQLNEIEVNYIDKMEKILHQHKYSILNETALGNFISIEEHLKLITTQLNVDGIVYISRKNEARYPKNFSPNGKFYRFPITDDFGNFPLNLNIYYKESLYRNNFLPLINIIIFIYSIFFIIICTLFYILFIKIKHKVIAPIVSLTNAIEGQHELLEDNTNPNLFLKEIYQLYFKISEYKKIENTKKFLELKEVELATRETLSKQVAHDIRSPLAVLNMMVKKYLHSLEEENRIIVRNQIDRIQDIANNLMTESKQALNNQVNETLDTEIKSQLLSSTIEEVITEKRIYFRSKLKISIEADIYDGESYGLFAKINTRIFKSMLSNIINNSAESFLNDQGVISIRLKNKSKTEVSIIIEDNGKGIPPEIMAKIGQEKISFGKKNDPNSGAGLGLFHARKTIEKWQGRIFIESEIGKGTKVHFVIPKICPPSWFVPQINLISNQAIVVLDDDQGIHVTWKNRFKEVICSEYKIHLYHISNPNDFESWLSENRKKFTDILYLSDYELIGFEETGLDLLEKHKLFNSILVTSYYDDEKIKKRCIALGIKIIPKMLAGFVPIEMI